MSVALRLFLVGMGRRRGLKDKKQTFKVIILTVFKGSYSKAYGYGLLSKLFFLQVLFQIQPLIVHLNYICNKR